MRSWYARNELAGTIVANGLVALLAWGLAELVVTPTYGGRTVTPIWPPVGLAVALTYIGGNRLLPGIVLGSFLVGIFRNPWPLALIVASVQIIQPIVDVRILRALKFDPRLERVRDPVILVAVAGPVGSFLAAVTAVGVYYVAGRIPQERAVARLPAVVAARLARCDCHRPADLRVDLRARHQLDVASSR